MGWHTPELTTVQTRLQGQAVWEIVFLLLNGLLFALVGLQLPSILDAHLRPLDGRADRLCGARQRGRGRRADRLAARDVRPRQAEQPRARWTTRVPSWQAKAVIALVRNARGRLAGRGAGAPADDRRRPGLSRPQPDHLPHLRRHLRHAGPAGPDARPADPRARPGRRRRRRAGGGEGAHPRRRGRAGAARRAGRSRTGCARTRPSGCAGSTASGRSASARATTPTATARSKSARRTTSACAASCSTPSAMAVTELRQQGVIGDDVMRRVVRDLDLEDARLDV